jgi:hypothetical protein
METMRKQKLETKNKRKIMEGGEKNEEYSMAAIPES